MSSTRETCSNAGAKIFPVTDVSGKVAVVTGAAKGIGLALTTRLLAAGATVVMADIDAEALAAPETILDGNAEFLGVQTDVASLESVERLRDIVLERFGRIELLFNNAGIVPPERHMRIWEVPVEDWQRTVAINLQGVANGIMAFVPEMLRSGRRGHIVNTASIGGLISGNHLSVYGASKHAVVRITEALLADLEDVGADIGVTLLCPGLVDTGILRDAERAEGIVATTPHPGAAAPDHIAALTLEAVARNQFYLVPTEAYDDAIAARTASILSRSEPALVRRNTIASERP